LFHIGRGGVVSCAPYLLTVRCNLRASEVGRAVIRHVVLIETVFL
jgi:hypothetical protein